MNIVFFGWAEAETEFTWHVGHYLAHCTSPGGDGWWVWTSRWNDWQRKPKYSEKTAPVSLFPPQIPHNLTSTGTRVAEVGSRRLTDRATARPYINITVTILDTIHRPVLYLQYSDLENGFCLRLEVAGVRKQRIALCKGSNWIGTTWRRRQNPVFEMLCSKWKTGRWIVFRIDS
jgi:hypothetical protein